MTDDTPELPPVHPKHLARDRFGKEALLAAHEITQALAEAGVDDDGVVVLRTDGPRHSFADLEALIDEALVEDAKQGAEQGADQGAEQGEDPKAT